MVKMTGSFWPGENGENIPFNPLLAPARNVDVIMALDASADTDTQYINNPIK
jgi:lysophospholipase